MRFAAETGTTVFREIYYSAAGHAGGARTRPRSFVKRYQCTRHRRLHRPLLPSLRDTIDAAVSWAVAAGQAPLPCLPGPNQSRIVT